MKRTVHVLLISLLVILSSCADEKLIDEPQEIGVQLFELVKNAQTTSEDDYLKYFVDFETIYDLRSKNIKEELRNSYTDEELLMSKDMYYNGLKVNHQFIKKEAIKEGIVLNEIKYLDFIYEPLWVDMDEDFEGHLYFTYKDNSYKMIGHAVRFGDEYIITGLWDLSKI